MKYVRLGYGSDAKHLARNLRVVSKVVIDNLLDDPQYFILQAARRIDSKLLSKAASLSSRFLPHRAPVLRAFCLLLSGNSGQLANHLLQVEPTKVSARTLARLGDMALAVQDAPSAKHLLSTEVAATTPLVRSRARHAWYLGDMHEAVRLLEGMVGPSNKQLRHYKSELDVFMGSSPSVNQVPRGVAYATEKNVALHFLTNSLPHTGSGYAQRSHSIMMALRDVGWTAEVLTRSGYPLTVGKISATEIDVVEDINYRRILPGKYRSDMKSRIQQQADGLALEVERLRPRVLHTTTDFTNALAVMSVARAYGIPWVYEVRGQLADTWASTRPDAAKNSERYKMFKEREAFVASHADLVVTLGEAMKAELVSQGIAPEKIMLAPNAVGGEYLDTPIERKVAREELGLDPELQYVGTVSSLVSYEGLDLLVRAVAELVPHNPRLRLLIVGSGVESNNLVTLTQELGIRDRCIFPGRVPREQARMYHCALNVFVVPRRDLSVTRAVTPLKPVEALACAVPVVAADLPALRELVQHEETGLLVEPESVEQLANAIQILVEEPLKSNAMGETGRLKVLEERTWEANAKKLSGSYKSMLGNTALNG